MNLTERICAFIDEYLCCCCIITESAKRKKTILELLKDMKESDDLYEASYDDSHIIDIKPESITLDEMVLELNPVDGPESEIMEDPIAELTDSEVNQVNSKFSIEDLDINSDSEDSDSWVIT